MPLHCEIRRGGDHLDRRAAYLPGRRKSRLPWSLVGGLEHILYVSIYVYIYIYILGRLIQTDVSFFFKGLKPPTRIVREN